MAYPHFNRSQEGHKLTLNQNVGGVAVINPTIRPIQEYSPDDIERTINLNARFMMLATRRLMPVLVRNGPSLILNLSSASRMGMPGLAPYSACKAFVLIFSKSTAREMRTSHSPVDILAIVAGDVESQQNSIALTPGTPSSRRFAQAMMDRAPRAVQLGRLEMAPWWLHAVQIGFLESLPEWLGQKLILQTFKEKEAAVAAFNERKLQ